MSKMKRLASLLLALALVLALGVSAFADDTTYTITINNETSGYTYVAYQIFAGTLDSTGTVLSDIEWSNGVDGTALLTALKADNTVVGTDADTQESITVASLFVNCTTAADVAQVLSDNSSNTALAERFAELAAANKTTTTSGTVTDNASTDGTYTISGLTAGYYLVVNTGVPSGTNTSYSDYILKVVTNVTVNPKDGVPTFDKEVDSTTDSEDETTADYAVGDDVPFTLKATLPSNYADYTTYALTFHDTLSDGLSFNSDSVVVTVYSSASDPGTVVESGYSVVSTELSDSCSFEVQITNTNALTDENGSAITVTSSSIIVVTYTAELTAELTADATTTYQTNTAYLEYSNDPNSSSTGTTPTDTTYVINMTLTVNKTDGNGTALAGAAFTLYKYDVTSSTYVEVETITGYTAVEIEEFEAGTTYYTLSNGEYTVVDTTTTTTPDADTTYYVYTGLTTFSFSGLDVGQYELVETTTPDGYNTADDLYFTISAVTTEESTTGASATVTVKDASGNTISTTSTSESATFYVSGTSLTTTVVNNAGSTLPSTGGIGTTIFYVIGSIMVLGAVVLLITRKRMSKAE
ncbi:MAG: isopeptide-forming domain-containing fimbrial protein [Oscillospiraceae bacterium]|nr:isopeptide-forming domain-containing fimbrial protein [Oscillospiraceae bacterium]